MMIQTWNRYLSASSRQQPNSAKMFSAKIGSLRKALRQRAEFHFIDAPHLVSADETTVLASGGTREGGRAWWLWQDIEEGMRPSLAANYTGWEESYKLIKRAVQEHNPDGILGFSQGATAAALYLAHAHTDDSRHLLKFAVLIAGFLPRDQTYAKALQSQGPDIPVFLVHGDKDNLIPSQRSVELQQALEIHTKSLQRFAHPGAHMVPSCSGAFKQELQAFLDLQRQRLVDLV